MGFVRSRSTFDFRGVDAESVSQVLQVFLLLGDDLAQYFAESEFAHGVGLPDPLAIVDQGLAFVLEIEAEHFLRFVRDFHFLRPVDWFAIEVIDLFGDLQRVAEFLRGVDDQFPRNVGKCRAFDRLAVNGIGDDRLVFAREIGRASCRERVSDTV